MIADKDEFLALFLKLISDKQGRMQREINTGNAEKKRNRDSKRETVRERERDSERERERDLIDPQLVIE